MTSSAPCSISDNLLTKHAPTPTGDADAREAAKLLHQFDATALGEGDLTAGANILAVMALAIANIAPPGSCLMDGKDGTRVPVGMGMLVSGALSCDIVSDRVLTILQTRQNHLYGHIRQWMEKNKLREQRVAATGLGLPKREAEEWPRPPFDELENTEFTEDQILDAHLRGLLRPPKNPGVRELAELPVLFASVGTVDALASVIDFAHRGRPLLHTTLSEIGDLALLARVCADVMSGCPKRKLLTGSISGEVIATDPLCMLGELINEGGKGTGWLQRLLWLSDHGAWPAFEAPEPAGSAAALRRVGARFEMAIEKVAARRLNFRDPAPMEVGVEFGRVQAAWNNYLSGLESRFPGITGTLRPLPASLTFGLLQMKLEGGEEAALPPLAMGDVMAFSRVLALRMVNAREIMREEGRRQHLEALAASIRLKLEEGPLTIRELTRKSHRLNAGTCQEVLERLATSGLVARVGSRWKLAPFKQPMPLTLDV